MVVSPFRGQIALEHEHNGSIRSSLARAAEQSYGAFLGRLLVATVQARWLQTSHVREPYPVNGRSAHQEQPFAFVVRWGVVPVSEGPVQ